MNSVLRKSMEGHYTPLNEDLTSSVCGTWKNSTFIFFQCRTEWNGILSIFVSSTEKIAQKFSFNVLLFVAEAKTIVWRSKNVVLVALWSTGFLKNIFSFFSLFPFLVVFPLVDSEKDCFQHFSFWAEKWVCVMSEHMLLNREMSRTRSTIMKKWSMVTKGTSCCLPRVLHNHIPPCFAAVLNRRSIGCPGRCYLQWPYAENGAAGNL